jgi:sterol desaturase/sphingolipid hydroxylase (fatty acid hydroxylase superfamily)
MGCPSRQASTTSVSPSASGQATPNQARYRHHPLEPLVGLLLVAPAIVTLGVGLEVAVGFKLFEVAITLFSHSNVRVPEALDRQMRRLILTPGFHRLHHCAEPGYTNSNYGSTVPWFDYLFGTASARPYDEQESMALGLEYLREPGDGRLDRIVTAPFQWSKATHPRPDCP